MLSMWFDLKVDIPLFLIKMIIRAVIVIIFTSSSSGI